MLRNACFKTSKLITSHKSTNSKYFVLQINEINKRYLSQQKTRWFRKDRTAQSTELTKVEAREILQKEFPEYFNNGRVITRISYVDYIDQALEKLKDLGLEKDINAYKELLRIFPPGKYYPKSSWDIGMHNAPQQLCAIRLLFQMETNMLFPDKEIEELVISAFSINSHVWQKVARGIYWSMKGRNVDPNPLPEKLPEQTHELAKVALVRMLEDPKSVISVRNTSSLPNVVDKTWVVYSQSPLQKILIDRLDKNTILYIEQFGNVYVGDKFLSYFILKYYEDEETINRRKIQNSKPPNFDYNSIKMQFFGKPIGEKLAQLQDMNQVDDGHILGLAITGTSSHDSALSWLKLMQQRNPNLNNLNVVFRLTSRVSEVLDPKNDINK